MWNKQLFESFGNWISHQSQCKTNTKNTKECGRIDLNLSRLHFLQHCNLYDLGHQPTNEVKQKGFMISLTLATIKWPDWGLSNQSHSSSDKINLASEYFAQVHAENGPTSNLTVDDQTHPSIWTRCTPRTVILSRRTRQSFSLLVWPGLRDTQCQGWQKKLNLCFSHIY